MMQHEVTCTEAVHPPPLVPLPPLSSVSHPSSPTPPFLGPQTIYFFHISLTEAYQQSLSSAKEDRKVKSVAKEGGKINVKICFQI